MYHSVQPSPGGFESLDSVFLEPETVVVRCLKPHWMDRFYVHLYRISISTEKGKNVLLSFMLYCLQYAPMLAVSPREGRLSCPHV